MEEDWDAVRGVRGWPSGATGTGLLRITLLFGSGMVALALILVSIVDSQTRDYAAGERAPYGLDDTVTGSIGGSGKVYTIHRSVLQPSRDSICVIHHDGTREGEC